MSSNTPDPENDGPELGSAKTDRKFKFWRIFFRVLLIILGAFLGAIIALFIGLYAGWIEIGC